MASSRKNQLLGNYRLDEFLGEGGMAEVFRAEHAAIGKEAAIKLLKPEYARRPEVITRFFHEAKVVNQVRHENLVDIFDFGQTKEGQHYIVMEFLQGTPLDEKLEAEAPLPIQKTTHLGLQICSALGAAHEAGIVHRDIKGCNIFLTTRAGQKDFVKILDFGIAKLLGQTDDRAIVKTQSGAMIGTPLTMSPEQARGEDVGPQTDIYALGVLLYQMATGTTPFYNDNAVLLALMHVSEPLIPPSKRYAAISPELEAVIIRCLEKDQKDRYQTMDELALDLEDVAPNHRASYVPAPRPRRSTLRSTKTTIADSQSTIPPVQLDSIHTTPKSKWRVAAFVGVLSILGVLVWFGITNFVPENTISSDPNKAALSATKNPVQTSPDTKTPVLPATENVSILQIPEPTSEPSNLEEEKKNIRRPIRKNTGKSVKTPVRKKKEEASESKNEKPLAKEDKNEEKESTPSKEEKKDTKPKDTKRKGLWIDEWD